MQLDPKRLTPGSIDEVAINYFLHGACGALTMALHDETGWPIVAITDHHNVYDGVSGWGSALHWAVEHPNGQLIDIEGLHDPEELVEQYHDEADDGIAAAARTTRAHVEEWYIENQGEPIPVSLARTFVRPLLKVIAEQLEAESNSRHTP